MNHVLNFFHTSFGSDVGVGDRRHDGPRPDGPRAADDPAAPLDAVAPGARAGDEADPAEVQARQGEAERRAHEVLPGEQDQPGCVVPADAPAAPGLHRALLHAQELRYELPLHDPADVRDVGRVEGCMQGRARPDRRARRAVVAALHPEHHGGRLGVGYVLLVVYVASQMASGLFMASPTAPKSQRIIFMVMPLVFVFVIANFPAGPCSLLGDDEPLDGRAGSHHAAARAADSRAGSPSGAPPGLPPQEDEGTSGNGASPEPPAPKPAPAANAAPRQVRRKKSSGRRR